MIGCNKVRENKSPLREHEIFVDDLFARVPGGAPHSTEVAHYFFYRLWSKPLLCAKKIELVWVLCE